MGSGQKILIVSEIAERARAIEHALQPHGFDLQTAASAGEALQFYEVSQAELVVSDFRLQGLKDLQLVDLLRRINQRVRFIMIAPAGGDIDFRQMTPNRVVAFLSDAFTPEELLQHVHEGFGSADDFYNRRRYSRYKLAIDTHCIQINPFTDSESRPIAGLIRDVSRSGLSMLIRQVAPVPSMLKLILEMPQTRHSVTLLAKSMSCTLTQIPNVYRLGAKFVGALPRELEHAISQWDAEHPNGDESDIFMGKTFKKAVEEWLKNHQAELGEGTAQRERSAPRPANEIAEKSSLTIDDIARLADAS